MEYGLLGLAIVGVISALKFSAAVNGLLTILIAVILGALAGFVGFQGLTVVTGILTGIAAVGAVTVADRINTTK